MTTRARAQTDLGPARDRIALEALARSRGVAPSYRDAGGSRRRVGSGSLAAVLEALGDPPAPAGALAPVLVAWDGHLPEVPLGRCGNGAGTFAYRFEAGDEELPELRVEERKGVACLVADGRLPLGYHLIVSDSKTPTTVIAAPSRGPAPPGGGAGWGLFAPAYALQDGRGHGSGDLSALERLGRLAAAHGAVLVATLPLLAELATADGAPRGQQPYAPLSRLWRNEAYLDLDRLPELSAVPRPSERDDTAGAGATRLADLAGRATRMRPYLEQAVLRLERSPSRRREQFRAFRRRHPGLEVYARFRAAIELAGADQSRWPASWRRGQLRADEVPALALERHAYAQFALDTQLAEVAAGLGELDCGLLLDLPVGCRPDGFDPWAHPGAFARSASVGAPPDDFFAGGQDWGFPPLHPEGDRALGYPLVRACLAQNLAHASALRIDHVLGLSRLWWIPEGCSAEQGAYVSYRLDELLAIACLEAWRAGAHLIGEDLGTVQQALRRALARHGISGMRVTLFELNGPDGTSHRPVPPVTPAARVTPPAPVAALIDTHDTATFASWLDGGEFEDRAALGLLSAAQVASLSAKRARVRAGLVAALAAEGRLAGTPARRGAAPTRRPARGAEPPDTLAVLAGMLEALGESDAALVLVNAEDLWAERRAQNVPGTGAQRANFAQLLAHRVEAIGADPVAMAILDRLDAARRRRARSLEGARLGR